ncbi:unnamed protein product [Urochloa humidicola]
MEGPRRRSSGAVRDLGRGTLNLMRRRQMRGTRAPCPAASNTAWSGRPPASGGRAPSSPSATAACGALVAELHKLCMADDREYEETGRACWTGMSSREDG